jgi:TAT (twin-arginine translocation) pathway signal sequence
VNRRDFLTIASATTAGVLLVGCSSGNGSKSSPSSVVDPAGRPLTSAEAELLAGALFKNYDVGGATFDLTASFRASGDSISLRGAIDWKNHIGAGAVTAVGAEADVTEVYWNSTDVLEQRKGLTDALAVAGHPGARFVDRAPDPTGRELDGLLGLLIGLAAKQRDNPQLIQQSDAARFLRADRVGDTAVSVFRYDSSVFWIDASGSIVRYDGVSNDGNRPVTIDLLALAAQDIAGPAAELVVPYESVAAVYDALRS